MATSDTCIAFSGARRLASGPRADVAIAVRRHLDLHSDAAVLVFDAASSRPLEFDLRGSPAEIAARLETAAEHSSQAQASEPRGRGRPKLGVVAREVTLLPRHWQWLSGQPGGASVALRKLVEAARTAKAPADAARMAQDSAYRFMTAMAGNLPGYEDAIRALFAGDTQGFARHSAGWPADVRDHAAQLAAPALTPR